jgi:tetratricopeptide (TPR) repeat protein
VGGILLLQGKLKDAEELLHRAIGLAHESGSKDAEAAAHRTLSELALVRGDLGDALKRTQAAVELQGSIDITAHVDDLRRTSRILAAQGDLEGARRNLVEALGVAVKIGAQGQTAESHLALAELDLEEGHAAAAELPMRNALKIFRQEKMSDDEMQGAVALSRCLLMQGKAKEAEAALAEGRATLVHSQNPAVHLTFAIAEVRVETAGPAPLSSRVLQHAKSELLAGSRRAVSLGFIPLSYEARLAWGEILARANPASGQRDLAALEQDARALGLGLIALQAARLRGSSS